jgi:hypothetical protein
MTQTRAIQQQSAAVTVEQALVSGDLSGLDPEQRVNYYLKVCSSLGLNAYTKPFDYIVLNGKLVLYARKDATDQLRKIHKVNILSVDHKQVGELLVVTVAASTPDGRRDSATGAVGTQSLKGDALANALMKAETKAKRRVTLSLCGLGMTDESEVDSIPNAYLPQPDEAYVPTREQEVDDVDMVRSADERIWKRYLEIVDQAHALGVREPRPTLVLPIARDVLKECGTKLVDAIAKKQEQLDREEAARIVAEAQGAAKSVDEMEIDRQRREEGLIQ